MMKEGEMDEYDLWTVYAPNGNITSLPANSMKQIAIRLAEMMLNTPWEELEALGFSLKSVGVIDRNPRSVSSLSIRFGDTP